MGARSVFHSAAHAECQAFTLLFLCWLQGCHGGRPVTLIGCSMGARLVFHCLLELARLGLRGCVENVILLGAPLSCRCGSGKGAIFGGHVLKGSDNGMAGPQGLCGERHTARGTPQLQVGREGGREDKGGSAYQLPCLQFLQKLRVDQLLCCMCSSTQYSLLHGSPGVQVQLIALQPYSTYVPRRLPSCLGDLHTDDSVCVVSLDALGPFLLDCCCAAGSIRSAAVPCSVSMCRLE
jgi:hypothetical protein